MPKKQEVYGKETLSLPCQQGPALVSVTVLAKVQVSVLLDYICMLTFKRQYSEGEGWKNQVISVGPEKIDGGLVVINF